MDRSTRGPSRAAGIVIGTEVLTPEGYRAIERLRRGDLVATLMGRGPMFVPIAWIGRRNVNLPGRDNRATESPIRVRRSAIGDGMPRRDILLAPDHAIYLKGSLYLAAHLVNHASILPEPSRCSTEYWGIRLDRHDILVAENLAIESLLPASSAAFAEVTTPFFRVVETRPGEAEQGAAWSDVPARILMSVRWFRRRLLARSRTGVAPVAAAFAQQPPVRRSDGLLVVESEVRFVMASLAGLAEQRGVRLEFAVSPDLLVRMQPDQLHELLGGMLTHAIHSTLGHRVLLGAMIQGGRLQIAVIDEGPGTSREQEEAELRRVAELAALQGGTLEIDTRPGEGTTILLRLLAEVWAS